MSRDSRKGKEFSPATMVAAYKRSGGFCEMVWDGVRCGLPLQTGRIEYDHKRAIGLGGDNSLENCVCACKPCHDRKTHGHDNPIMRKADAQQKVHIGATRQKAKIPSRRKPAKEPRDKLPLPERRGLYVDET